VRQVFGLVGAGGLVDVIVDIAVAQMAEGQGTRSGNGALDCRRRPNASSRAI